MKADLDQLRQDILADPDIPPNVQRFLASGATLEEIRLDAHGTWHHQGEAFANRRLATLFHRSLTQTRAGNWVLRIAPYTYPVIVEATGRFIVRLDLDDQAPVAHLADGRIITLDDHDLLTDGNTFVGAIIKPDGLLARCIRTAWTTVQDRLDEDQGTFVLRGREKTFRLNRMDSATPPSATR